MDNPQFEFDKAIKFQNEVESHNEIDIALDTFPCNGTTTT